MSRFKLKTSRFLVFVLCQRPNRLAASHSKNWRKKAHISHQNNSWASVRTQRQTWMAKSTSYHFKIDVHPTTNNFDVSLWLFRRAHRQIYRGAQQQSPKKNDVCVFSLFLSGDALCTFGRDESLFPQNSENKCGKQFFFPAARIHEQYINSG